jgi:hypothetical protein
MALCRRKWRKTRWLCLQRSCNSISRADYLHMLQSAIKGVRMGGRYLTAAIGLNGHVRSDGIERNHGRHDQFLQNAALE